MSQNQKPKKKPSQSKNPAKQVKKIVAKKAVKQANMMDKVLSAQAQQVVESIACPRESEAVRLGTVYGTYKTSTAKPYLRQTPGWGDFSAAGANNDTCCFAFRDPYCCCIVPYRTSTTSNYSYTFSQQFSQQSMALKIPYLSWSTGAQIHGPILFPGRLPDQRDQWYYITNGVASFQNTGATTINITTLLFNDDVITDLGLTTIAGGASSSLTSAQTGYVAFRAYGNANSVTCTGILTIGYGSGLNFSHLALNGMNNNSAAAEAFKMYGVSLMYTNTASPLNRQGKVCGLQVPAGSWWDQYTSYQSLADLESAVSLEAVNGIYGFLKPTQPNDINFRAFDTVTTNSLSTDAYWPLRRDSDFLAVALNVLATSNGQDGYFTIAHAFEYRTTDPWREVEMAYIPPDTVDLAMMLVSRCPQWHENPLHLADIWKWIKKTSQDVYEGVKDSLPGIVNGATTVAKIGGALIPLML